MVRRHHAGLAVAGKLRAVDEIEDRIVHPEIEDEALPRAFDLLVLQRARAAHDRRNIRAVGDLLRQLRAREHSLAAALEPFLRERHMLDHALVGFARIRAEREDAVPVQDQAFDRGIALE